ncbi:hypothetical protein GMA8713_04199 [Grimontia marina]|uniref:Uncharacterized protein n=1 Tax=Grimontia marina TaxID=646534 RepID=A0A128FIR1_9GAMM|nr:hypothetical protein GMA8713_04199 [Grimontia marina]
MPILNRFSDLGDRFSSPKLQFEGHFNTVKKSDFAVLKMRPFVLISYIEKRRSIQYLCVYEWTIHLFKSDNAILANNKIVESP